MKRLAAPALIALSVLLATGCDGAGEQATAADEPAAPEAAASEVELGSCEGRKPKIPLEGFRCGSIEVPKFYAAPEKGAFDIKFAVREPKGGDSGELPIFAVEDLDAIREALGYETIALYGDSYGTFLGQTSPSAIPTGSTP